MPDLKIPVQPALKTLEVYTPESPAPPNAPPAPEYLVCFEVAGVAEEDVCKVLVALVTRRLVERARKAARGKTTLAKPRLVSLLAAGLIGCVVGTLLGFSMAAAFGHSVFEPNLRSVTTGAVAGALLGVLYGLWRRAKLITAYNGLELVSADAEQRLHPNYWLPTAMRDLCSPKPGLWLQA